MNVPNFNFNPDELPAVQHGRAPAPVYLRAQLPVNSVDDNFSSEEQSDYRKLFYMLLGLVMKHRWLIAGVCSIAIVIGFIVNFVMTPIYRATAIIQIDREAPKVVKLDNSFLNGNFGDVLRFYETQYDLLRSRSLAERVAANLDLGAQQDFLYPTSNSGWGKLSHLIFPSAAKADKRSFTDKTAVAAGMVKGNLLIEPVPNSSLVKISFDSPSRIWAQQIANAVAENYISSNLDRRYSATEYARNFLKERLDELKLKLAESEKVLVAYADQKEIITEGEGKPSLAESDLSSLASALQKVSDRTNPSSRAMGTGKHGQRPRAAPNPARPVSSDPAGAPRHVSGRLSRQAGNVQAGLSRHAPAQGADRSDRS